MIPLILLIYTTMMVNFQYIYNEIITKDQSSYQITTGVDKSQSVKNNKDIKKAIAGELEVSKS